MKELHKKSRIMYTLFCRRAGLLLANTLLGVGRNPAGIYLLLFALVSISAAAESEDPVFRAMQNELDRSIKQLVMKDTQLPYFLSYRVEDVESATIEARYGALTETARQKNRYLYVELRVGDQKLDNSNFVNDWDDIYTMREDLVDEDDYRAIRHKLWLMTDDAYKRALETLSRKRAYLQTHPTQDTLSDFSPAEHLKIMDKPVHLTGDMTLWENAVRTAAKALGESPALQDWKVTCSAIASAKRYVNSEGAQHQKSAVNQILEISASSQAPDGQRLSGFLRYITPTETNPPPGDQLEKDIRKLAGDLSSAALAPSLDEYSGPVLFTDYAAAQLISQLFVGQLGPTREILKAQDWMSRYLPESGKLAGRLNRRVMPDFMTVTDDPSLTTYENNPLLGFQVVDDEGVPSKTITLVKDGRLVSLPSSRQPIKNISGSNGHAMTFENQWTVPVVSNLMVKTSKPQPLIEKLRQLCKESGSEFGLLITLLEDRRISRDYTWAQPKQEDPVMLTSPMLLYKVYAKDGKIEPVRGLDFDEVSIRSLRDIAALGKDSKSYGILQPALRQFQYAISIVTPSILIEEMELKRATDHEPMPMSANPMFEK
jgi:predicted Zn-dependent protease